MCPLCYALDTASHLCISCLLSCSCSAVEFLSSLCNPRHSPSLWQTMLGPGPVVVIGSRCWGSNRGVSVHGPVCIVLSASLATPRSMEAAASILFFPELFMPRCQYNTVAVKEGFLGRGMSRLSFTVMLRERYGASGGLWWNGLRNLCLTWLGWTVSKVSPPDKCQKAGLLHTCVKREGKLPFPL